MGGKKRAENVLTVTDMIPVKYWVGDIDRLRRKYHPGQRITVMRVRVDGEKNLRHPERRRYTVVKTFPRHVSCVDGHGLRESFNYFELEQAAI